MRSADVRDYLALRTHLARPWRFLRLRGRPLPGPVVEVPLRDGRTIRLRSAPMDRHIFHRIFARDEYGLEEFAPGSFGTVIDVGAHAGFFAVRASGLAGRILCYEPDPSNFELLEHNLAPFPNVRLHRLAVAGRRGSALLFRSSNPSSHSMFPSEAARRVDGIEVPCATLAEILEENRVERCDLLKLDCEGAEYDILFGLPAALWPRIARVRMEYHAVADAPREWTGEGLGAFLVSRGYEVRVERSKRRPGKGHLFAARPRG